MKTGAIKIIARTGLLLVVLFLAVSASYLRAETPGTTFATYGIDLKIDNKAFYNGLAVPGSTWSLKNLVPTADHFFLFDDIKPGDYGRTVISTHVGKENAFLCLDFKNLTNKDNGVNEPESIVDPNGNVSGELAKGTEFFGWLDQNGNGLFNPGEKILFGTSTQSATDVINNKTYIIGDSKVGGECKVNQTRYVGIMWCAGDLSVNTTTGAVSCNGSALGNEAQTDSFSVDIALRAMPSKENPKFACMDGHTPPPPPPPKECEKYSHEKKDKDKYEKCKKDDKDKHEKEDHKNDDKKGDDSHYQVQWKPVRW